MTELRSRIVAVYARAPGPDDRTLDEQVRLTRNYLRWEFESGRWADAVVCYYFDPLPVDDGKLCWGLERLMDDAEAGKVLVVVCDRLNRFGDSPARAARNLGFLESQDVHLVLLEEGVDAARLPRKVLAELAKSILESTPLAEPKAESALRDGLRIATYERTAYDGADAIAAIDSQVRRVEAFIASQENSSGWKIRSHVRYQDIDASGYDRDRPGLQQLERDLAARQIDVLICTRVDRLLRNTHDLLELLELFQSQGIRFIALYDDIGVSTNSSITPAGVDAILKARDAKRQRPGE
jgi:DNA invertase Pin-like site-specific DNA recombinase